MMMESHISSYFFLPRPENLPPSLPLVHHQFHKSSLSPLLLTSPSATPTFDNSSFDASPCCQTEGKLPTSVEKLAKFDKNVAHTECHYKKIFLFNLVRILIIASMQFEKMKFFEFWSQWGATASRVSLECGQFPTMEIPLIYDLRYQLPNLFL